jgi:hypothetical protein
MFKKTYDLGSSLFLLLLSIFVCAESIRLEIGTLRDPGPGFMAFGASMLLGMLSLIFFVNVLLKKEDAEIQRLFFGKLWKKVIPVLIALLIYSKLMPVGGYLISTFLLMNFLLWIVERQKMWWTLVISLLTTVITYYVFSKWLNCQFPSGLFGL